jgi:hypothetical protein
LDLNEITWKYFPEKVWREMERRASRTFESRARFQNRPRHGATISTPRWELAREAAHPRGGVIESSGYHLACARIGRCVGRMTPRN